MCKLLICMGAVVVLAGIALAWNFTQAAILLEPFRITYSKRYEPMMRQKLFGTKGKQPIGERGWTDGFQCKPYYPGGNAANQ